MLSAENNSWTGVFLGFFSFLFLHLGFGSHFYGFAQQFMRDEIWTCFRERNLYWLDFCYSRVLKILPLPWAFLICLGFTEFTERGISLQEPKEIHTTWDLNWVIPMPINFSPSYDYFQIMEDKEHRLRGGKWPQATEAMDSFFWSFSF